ncbi:hypothetical protein KEM52_000346 [Ascosphaera acerosa]|nr:hypothetical protein KEM52_000346 [Ascosphaera acerosa]
MCHYFARTGLLDGRNGRNKVNKKHDLSAIDLSLANGHVEAPMVESPVDEVIFDEDWDFSDEEMLPPTVSTYSKHEKRIPPPPDVEVLRLDLQSALDEAEREINADRSCGQGASAPAADKHDLKVSRVRPHSAIAENIGPDADTIDPDATEAFPDAPQIPMHEIHGIRTLNSITNAITCARSYYTSHDHPERLKMISPERRIRKDLLNVLDMLRCWASRDFDGGLRDGERGVLLNWIQDARHMLEEDRRLEEQDQLRRQNLAWVTGDWTGRERERNAAFLAYLETTGEALPEWTPVDDETPADDQLPTPFLARVRDGRDLVRFHNEAVRQSKRRFGEIKSYHLDVGKPYRQTENLLFFAKASEIRWEQKLDLNVANIVNDTGPEAWRKLDAALMLWCRVVRDELIRDWTEMEAEKKKARSRTSLGFEGLASVIDDGMKPH